MRILCSVCVVNRHLANVIVPLKNVNKYLKSTLALCKQPNDDYCLLLFSGRNESGAKYKLKQNIRTILTKFIGEGKATIQFKQPEHDLFVQADTLQLKHFLVLIKKILENKIMPQDIKLSSMTVTAMKPKDVAPKQLIIKSRSQYPIKGFPRTLEVLQINDVRRLSMDKGILHLTKLKTLDLSNNLIEFIPKELNLLPNLLEINIKSNRLGSGNARQWDWMGGKLSSTLKSLNIGDNQLKYLPKQLTRLHALVNLNIDNNELTNLPSGIGNMRNLRIFHANNNRISSLPGNISRLKLETLSLLNNDLAAPGNNDNNSANFTVTAPLYSLKEYSARKVLSAKLSYTTETLPLTLIQFLESANFCVCGEACFQNYVQTKGMLSLRTIATDLHLSSMSPDIVPVDLIFCSIRCHTRSKRRKLVR